MSNKKRPPRVVGMPKETFDRDRGSEPVIPPLPSISLNDVKAIIGDQVIIIVQQAAEIERLNSLVNTMHQRILETERLTTPE